MQPALNNY